MNSDRSGARLYYLFRTNGPQGTPWLARLPAGLFAIPLGLLELVSAWRRAASHGWRLAAEIADGLIWPVTAMWALSLLLYALKYKRYPQAVLREFRHPVQGPLQALLPLSILLAIILFQQPGQGIWLVLALLALAVNAVVALRIITALARRQFPANAVTPALHLPIVGGTLIGSMALASLGYHNWSVLLFGAGLAGWALLEVRVLSRLSEGPMPDALRPTIGLELMPPAIATLAAAMVWPELPGDVLTVGLGAAVAALIGVLARYRWWTETPFSLGFWSFSFPLAALASAALEAAHRGDWPQWSGNTILVATSAITAGLALRTTLLLLQGKLFPAE